jgi:hypothetical protein
MLLIAQNQTSTTMPFDNSSNGFTSTTVQEAIEEAKASAVSGTEQHSWNVIDSNKTILANRQMIVYQQCEILANYELTLLGELVVLD